MRKTTSQSGAFVITACLCVALVAASCLPKPPAEGGDITITLYGFSIMKESLEKAIIPGFAARWKQLHGQEVRFQSSFAGSETITNQILQGAPSEVAILSIERDAQRLKQGGFTTSDWRSYPSRGVVNKTPFIIIVRKGNPKGIRDFADLGKPGVQLIHPDPVSSGGAQWSILAIYGSELKKSEVESTEQDKARALQTLQVDLEECKSDTGLGARGTNNVRARQRRRADNLRARRAIDEGSKRAHRDRRAALDDLQRASGGSDR